MPFMNKFDFKTGNAVRFDGTPVHCTEIEVEGDQKRYFYDPYETLYTIPRMDQRNVPSLTMVGDSMSADPEYRGSRFFVNLDVGDHGEHVEGIIQWCKKNDLCVLHPSYDSSVGVTAVVHPLLPYDPAFAAGLRDVVHSAMNGEEPFKNRIGTR